MGKSFVWKLFERVGVHLLAHLNGFKHSKLFKISFLPCDGTITGIITQDHGGPGNNGNKGELNIRQCYGTGASP